MFGILYKITNKLNNKSYIGQTTYILRKRWLEHCKPKKYSYLYSAINKHGENSFELKVIARCDTIEEMNHREQYYIKLFNTLAPNGYNLDSGGKNKKLHPSTKLKLSIKAKMRPGPNKGKKLSEKHKKNMSLANIGKKASVESRQKMSLARKGWRGAWLGKHLSNEHKLKLSLASKAHWLKRKLNTFV